jgi:hypothetical protein
VLGAAAKPYVFGPGPLAAIAPKKKLAIIPASAKWMMKSRIKATLNSTSNLGSGALKQD